MTHGGGGGIAGVVLRAFLLSIGQLGDRRIRAVLVKSTLVTLAVFAILGLGVWFGVRRLTDRADGGVAALVALAVVLLALWTTFRAVGVAVIGLFADAVVEAVEARHYPAALESARAVPVLRAAAMGLRSVGRVVALNALMLPVYAALLLTGVGTAAAFFAVNAWLLGRDLADMVAARHMAPATLRAWHATTRPGRMLLGLVATALFVVPLVNILAPVLGAAMATHWFHRGRAAAARREGSA